MKPTLLVVDDELAIRKLLQFFFQKEFNVECHDNADEAMDWMSEGNTPDVVIADINMPGKSGKEFLKELREQTETSQLPFIFLSGNEKTSDRIECLKLGADDYVVKPFNPEELSARVQVLLSRRSVKA